MKKRLTTEEEFTELVLQYEDYVYSLTNSQDYHHLYDKIRKYIKWYLAEHNYYLTTKQEVLLVSIRDEIIRKDEGF